MTMILMLCTAARGGMRAVVEGYRRDGLFERHAVELIETHREGGVLVRLRAALTALWRFVRLLATGDVKAVHAHVAMRGSFWRKSLFMSIARLWGIPVIAHLHGSEFKDFYQSQPPFLKRRIVGQLRSASRVIVLSDSWRAFVLSIAPGSQVGVIPNYVQVPGLERTPRQPSGQVLNVLFLGVIGARKGVFDLLPAWADVLQACPEMRLWIGGNGDVEAATRAAEELRIAHAVEFLGWIGPEQKDELLRSADIYVLPSHNEGLPMSILEAMAYAVPVIATRVGGIPELFDDGVDGLLIDAGDRPALREAILALARDGARRVAMGSAARAKVESKYAGAVVLPRLEEIYTSMLGPPSAPRLGEQQEPRS